MNPGCSLITIRPVTTIIHKFLNNKSEPLSVRQHVVRRRCFIVAGPSRMCGGVLRSGDGGGSLVIRLHGAAESLERGLWNVSASRWVDDRRRTVETRGGKNCGGSTSNPHARVCVCFLLSSTSASVQLVVYHQTLCARELRGWRRQGTGDRGHVHVEEVCPQPRFGFYKLDREHVPALFGGHVAFISGLTHTRMHTDTHVHTR